MALRTGNGLPEGAIDAAGEGETAGAAGDNCGETTAVGFGVSLACAEADGAAGNAAAPPGAARAIGVAIGPAGTGFLFASSTTLNSIARSTGRRTVPLFLSIQA